MLGEQESVNIVDIFAGPGGLGEGFSSFEVRRGKSVVRPFQIAVSAEKDITARSTLMLRAFYRRFGRPEDVPDAYYELITGERQIESLPLALRREWREAEEEALHLELGPETDRLHEAIRAKKIGAEKPWVLIGGPPCQAYSLVGRSRNKGKSDYVPEADHRHFLYREYLKILARFSPHVFIMENVKGILTSTVNGHQIFETMLGDLHNPAKAMGSRSGPLYDIYPLSVDAPGGPFPIDRQSGLDRFLIRAEDVGIPQARHRVILLGVRRGLTERVPEKLHARERVAIEDVIGDLPKLRSGVSGSIDSEELWLEAVERQRRVVVKALKSRPSLSDVLQSVRDIEFSGGPRESEKKPDGRKLLAHRDWYIDPRLDATLNHSTRRHQPDDLGRYLYCAAFAKVREGKSPLSSPALFPAELAPDHASWESGDFPNRFRVQGYGRPSSTVMSHIAKDGHYYIHPDVSQCRSFTVREAARAQTFPDNYFFLGGRTAQYIQVGNAVPPLLARQIAKVVWSVLAS